jgi:UDP-GlcNAc:undecaprenyl-phosphate/decaprenyl-phosphate GlcNAc-1-phosphate transferase
MLYSLVFLGAVSFFVTLTITPLIRNFFNRWEMVDHPDASRKHHKAAVPRVGGVAIAIAYLFAFTLLLRGANASIFDREVLQLVVRLSPAALLIFGVGLFDDLFTLRPWQKLCGEIAAAGLAYWAGVHVQGFGGKVFGDWWGLPLTVGWLVLCTNAVNLIDGVDGLAAGIGLFATTTMLLAAVLQGNILLAMLTVPLVGCLAGFLRYNFNPATIFLGDSGSLLIGFLLGCYGVLWSQKSATILGMTAPLMALSIPLLDTVLAITRRFLRGQPIFGADRNHIHHRLLDRGLTPRKVAFVLYGVCAMCAILSLLVENRSFESLVIPIFCAVVWIGIQHLGYIEFGVAGRMVLQGAFRRQLSAQISLQHFEQLLQSASTPQECWTVIESACREFGFQHVRLVYAGYEFEFRDKTITSGAWDIQVPLSDGDAMHLVRAFGETAHSSIVGHFIDVVRTTLTSKLTEVGVASTHLKAQEKTIAAIVAQHSNLQTR